MPKKTKAPIDPHFQRESEKYENPIPSREFILEFLDKHQGPANFNEILEGLDLSTDDQQVALSRRLRAMERDGQLVRNRKEGYGPVDKLHLIKGKVEAHRDGYGFFIPENGGEDWFLSAREMRRVFHGERVVVRFKGLDNKRRKEGKIVEILSSDEPIQIVGRIHKESGITFVKPNDTRYVQDIIIAPGTDAGATDGQVVVARVTSRPTDKSQPVGAVVDVLGDYLAPGMEIDIAIHNYDIRRDWPNEVLDELRFLKPEVSEKDKKGRVDLRHLPLVTIDGEDARDFDDAVYCEWKESGGWRLWVAIADVSHYVQPGSALDKEASLRGNSVYFPEYVVPMFPEQISNGLCSLNPKVDRLCMVCEITVSVKGKISGYRFYPAVMHSHARLTYNQVWAMLEGDEALTKQHRDLMPHIENLYSLYKVRANERKNRGAIEFETTETKFVFNENRKIERVEPLIRNDAHRIIEECMICANVATARFFIKKKMPGLYRVHEGPPEKKLEDLKSYLAELGLFLFGGKEPSPRDFSELLKGVQERPDAEQIQTMLLRSMTQAVYSPDNKGHFGLAFTAYTHFTSPIRRYPDLLIHRLIKHGIRNDGEGTDKHSLSFKVIGEREYTFDELVRYGEGCSATERNADMATRDVMDWLKCEFMTSRIGHQFNGKVVSVTNFGLFVRLEEVFIEGLIHITSLGNDYYRYDQSRQRLVGESSGKSFKLGDELLVEVIRANLEDRKIDFELVNKHKDAGSRKTSEREKLYRQARAKVKGDKSRRSGDSNERSPAGAGENERGSKNSGRKPAKKKPATKKPSKKKPSGKSGGKKTTGKKPAGKKTSDKKPSAKKKRN